GFSYRGGGSRFAVCSTQRSDQDLIALQGYDRIGRHKGNIGRIVAFASDQRKYRCKARRYKEIFHRSQIRFNWQDSTTSVGLPTFDDRWHGDYPYCWKSQSTYTADDGGKRHP